MKIRQGFVSNSSSCSFLIKKELLNELQIEQIKNHIKVASKLDPIGVGCHIDNLDSWNIREEGIFLHGFTIMDNFNMSDFMELIGVPIDEVQWD